MGARRVSWYNYSKIFVQSRCCNYAHALDSINALTQVVDQAIVGDVVGTTCTLWNWKYVKIASWQTFWMNDIRLELISGEPCNWTCCNCYMLFVHFSPIVHYFSFGWLLNGSIYFHMVSNKHVMQSLRQATFFSR
jgi:hypothetical protein